MTAKRHLANSGTFKIMYKDALKFLQLLKKAGRHSSITKS